MLTAYKDSTVTVSSSGVELSVFISVVVCLYCQYVECFSSALHKRNKCDISNLGDEIALLIRDE